MHFCTAAKLIKPVHTGFLSKYWSSVDRARARATLVGARLVNPLPHGDL